MKKPTSKRRLNRASNRLYKEKIDLSSDLLGKIDNKYQSELKGVQFLDVHQVISFIISSRMYFCLFAYFILFWFY